MREQYGDGALIAVIRPPGGNDAPTSEDRLGFCGRRLWASVI